MLNILAAICAPALAVDGLILEVGDPVTVGVDGRHGRPFVGQDGTWHLAHGRSGHLHDVALNDDLVADLSTAQILVDGGGRFVDHGLSQCPDGSLLHAASGNVDEPDDSAWVTWITPNLEPGPTVLVVDRDPNTVTNDMAVLCTDELRLVAFAGEGDWDLEIPQRNWLHVLNDAMLAGTGVPDIRPLHEATRVNGTSMVWDEASNQIMFVAMPGGSSVQVNAYDTSYQWAGRLQMALHLDDDRQSYWSAGAIPLGDGFAVVHLARRFEDGFAQDQGDVVLTLFGPDFFFHDSVVLTSLDPPNGAMRPAIARRGDELLVAWDRNGRFTAVGVVLDPAADEALSSGAPQDTAEPPAIDGQEEEEDSTANEPAAARGDGKGCAVVQAGTTAGLAVLAVAAVARRMKRW